MDLSSGIQVLTTSRNCASYLNKCFETVETALKGFKWMMVFCDDASADETEEVVNAYKTGTSADKIIYKKFDKAETIGQAKNRTCLISLQNKEEYPVLCFMDADDEMGEERVSGLLPHLTEEEPFVFGDYIYQDLNDGEDSKKMLMVAERRNPYLTFGHWATLIHSNLVPENGIFFREDIENYDEMLTWWELRYSKNVKIKPVSGVMTNFYRRNRPNSCSWTFRNEKDQEILAKLREKMNEIYPIGPH